MGGFAERPGPELTPNSGNTMAQVDRSSAYSDPDRDKQFNQKNSESPKKGRMISVPRRSSREKKPLTARRKQTKI